MRIELEYIATGTKVRTPVQVEIKKTSITAIAPYATKQREKRDNWCIAKQPCSKYNQRPCCPPKCKLIHEMQPHANFYLVCASCHIVEYFHTHPKVVAQKSANYFALQGTHVMTRNINNRICDHFTGQIFRVGGCTGCKFKTTGQCKRFAPSLEAAGVNVVRLAKDFFDVDIEWYQNKIMMSTMYAIGGVYTDTDIKPSTFKKVIKEACNHAIS